MTTHGAAPVPASRESYEPVDAAAGADGAGARVLKIGDPDAKRILILVGGREGGASAFGSFGRELTRATPDLQVWSVDRREQSLADLTGFAMSPAAATGYYLDGEYRGPKDPSAAAHWGLEALVQDLRRIVRSASDKGRRQVVLGGLSVGANAVLNYAAWDFDGEAGYSDLAGIVIADGGVYDAYSGAGMEFGLTLDAAKGWLGQVEDGAVFENATSEATELGTRPESAAIWLQLAAQHALNAPHDPSALASRLPEGVRPARPMTNLGLFGWLVDASGRHPSYSVNAGTLSSDGDWVDGGPTSLQTVAEAFAGPEPGAWVWYTLNRLMLDYVATIDFVESEITQFLGLPIKHAADIDVPLYAFQSGLTGGTVGRAAAKVAANTKITEAPVHSDLTLAHQDLVYARWADNKFLRTVSQFIDALPGTA
jgi:hypothetical protein